jgi:UDP-2,3-diacylglucosamine pyrophosphatase LpxH
MKTIHFFTVFFLLASGVSIAQGQGNGTVPGTIIDFISDTQQPMLVEKIVLKPTHNLKATSLLFAEILKTKPQSLYMLGDLVSLGFRNRKWKKVDRFLDSCRNQHTTVCGLLGNHDVMGRRKKGEENFNKRFPENVRTGYVSVTDSVAIILLNSNFNKLSAADKNKQDNWYRAALNNFDTSEAIKAVIVTCHHAPYTNSKIVGSSAQVQKKFVAPFINSKKGRLFITGHAHGFEHFKIMGKDFLVIGGGGGLHQPLNTSERSLPDVASAYKPLFHFLSVQRFADELSVTSRFLKADFAGFGTGYSFITTPSSGAVTNAEVQTGPANPF